MTLLSELDPDRICLRDMKRSLSGAKVSAQCDEFIGFLAEEKIRRLALFAENGIDWVLVDLACQAAGICLIPLPTFFSAQQIRHVMQLCDIDAVVTDRPELLAKISQAKISFSQCAGLHKLQLGQLGTGANSARLPAGTDKITFTSGSTGQPKGVCLSTEHLLQQAQRLCQEVGVEHPRHLCLLPLSTLLENVAGVYAPLLAQGEILVPGQRQLGFEGSALVDPQQLLTQLAILQPHTLILIPQLLTLLVAAATRGWRVPASLKFVAVGGARVSMDSINAARAAGIPVYEGYGLSECASVVSLNAPAHDKPGTCGKPLPGLDLTIENDEVIVHGSSMLGYVNDPESWGLESVATGDVGHFDAEGFLSISGRKKNVLISSYGRNISPEWVESELLAHPLITEAVVIGDALPFCSALLFVRSDQTSNFDLQAWIERVNANLPDYAQVRKWIRLDQPLAMNREFMTENGRPRRDNINTAFQAEIENLYIYSADSRMAAGSM